MQLTDTTTDDPLTSTSHLVAEDDGTRGREILKDRKEIEDVEDTSFDACVLRDDGTNQEATITSFVQFELPQALKVRNTCYYQQFFFFQI